EREEADEDPEQEPVAPDGQPVARQFSANAVAQTSGAPQASKRRRSRRGRRGAQVLVCVLVPSSAPRLAGMATTVTERRLLVGGEWVESGEWLEIRSPYSGDVIGRVAKVGAAETRRAID